MRMSSSATENWGESRQITVSAIELRLHEKDFGHDLATSLWLWGDKNRDL
jgi:hypothetical protein